MGLFTELTALEAQPLCAAYGFDVARVEPLSAGSVNSNFRLVDTAGRAYFARVYEEQAVEGARAERKLLLELLRAGVPVAAPLLPGDLGILMHRGKAFAVYPWVDGQILCQGRTTAAHCRAVGEALARLHLATPVVTPVSGGRFRADDLRVRLDRINRESPAHRDVALHIGRRLDHYSARQRQDLPNGVIHGDLFRDNVLFQGDQVRALLDFESASMGVFAFDVMVTLLAWCYGDTFEKGCVIALLEGYTSLRPFEPAERDALGVEGALACLRFATTRITDFSMRAAAGQAPLRDYRRFLERLEALERGVIDSWLEALG